jgi:uncharacterized repeat protein (TIGR01451 family)
MPGIIVAAGSAPEIVPFERFDITIVNTATISSDQTPPTSDTVDNHLVSLVDPVITKAVDPTQAHPGDVVTFTLTVRQNPGSNGSVTNVQIVDYIPIYVDILNVVTTTGTVEVAGRVITWTISELAPSQVEMMTIRTLVNSNANPPPVTIRNQAILSFDRQEYGRVSNIVAVLVPAPPGGGDHHHHEQPTPTAPPAPVPSATPTPPVYFLPETGEGPPPPPDGSAWPELAMILMALLVIALVFRPSKKDEG